MEELKWILIGGLVSWLIYRALKRPPPSTRWKSFAETNGLDLSPSTPFALARIRGLWRLGETGPPIPVSIQILRNTRTRSGGILISARVPSGLPRGLCLGAHSVRESQNPGLFHGIRSQNLAKRIREENLNRPLSRFFEDWPEALIAHGQVQLRLKQRGVDPQVPVEALVELCRILDSGEPSSPKDLVIAKGISTEPVPPTGLSSDTIEAEELARKTAPDPGIKLQDWTPFGSPFGLQAPDMAPPGRDPAKGPIPPEAEWALPELSEENRRQLIRLANSSNSSEQRALLRSLERQPLSLTQEVRSRAPTQDGFLPPEYREGESTLGPLIGLNVNGRIRHPQSDPAEKNRPWAVQIVDWDPVEACLIGNRHLLRMD